MSNVCDNCSKFRDLNPLVCGCSFNYRFTMWINDTERPVFFIWGSIIPDIFRKCFSTSVIGDSNIANCKKICPYYYYYKDPTNFDLGYAKRVVELIPEIQIKALFYNGYSAPSFEYISSFNANGMKLTNSDIIKFNTLISTIDENVLTRKLSKEYLDNHQVTFFNYFTILYPTYTLISQYINFVFKSMKTYQYLIDNKKFLCKADIYWEYTLECDAKLRNKKTIKINETTLSQLYVLLEQYLANGYTTYSYYQDFFDTIRYALQVYSSIYTVFSKNFNRRQMPLYNQLDNTFICKQPYMSNSYKQKCRTIYNIYMTNKSKIYTNKVLGENTIDKDLDFGSVLANLIFVKVSQQEGSQNLIRTDIIQSFKENYPILDYNFTDDNHNNIEKYYFLEKGEKLEIDLNKINGIICWNYFNDIFLDTNEILKDFNYNNKINIKVYDNICIYVFYT